MDLNDFIYELTTTSSVTNKAVATIKYNVETPQKDKDGKVIYTDIPKKDSDGNPVIASRTAWISRKNSLLK